MTTAADSTLLKLTGRAGLLATVPALLGFHPSESLVLMTLGGPRHRVGPIMRVDLAGDPPGLAGCLAEQANSHGGEVVVLAYTEAPDPPALLDRVLTELMTAGARVVDVMVVASGVARPYHSGGRPLLVPDADHPATQELSAALAFCGKAVLPDRDALTRSVAGPTGARADAVFPVFDRVARELTELLEVTPAGAPDPLIELARRTALSAMADCDHHGTPTLANSVRLALLSTDVTVRDDLIRCSFRQPDQPWIPMLISAVAQVPDPQATELCAALAVLAYRRGEGALAQVLCARVLGCEPEHRLVGLLLRAMAVAMPTELLAALAEFEPGRAAAG